MLGEMFSDWGLMKTRLGEARDFFSFMELEIKKLKKELKRG